MTSLTLNGHCAVSDLAAWFDQAVAGATVQIIIPAMQHWRLEITKTCTARDVILYPEKHRPKILPLSELLTMLHDMQQGLTTRSDHPTA